MEGEPIIDPDLIIVDASHSLGMKGLEVEGVTRFVTLGRVEFLGWEGVGSTHQQRTKP